MKHPASEPARRRAETRRPRLPVERVRARPQLRIRKSPRTQPKGAMETNVSSSGRTATHRITVTEGKSQRVGRLLIRIQRKRRHRGQYRVMLIEDGAHPIEPPGN